MLVELGAEVSRNRLEAVRLSESCLTVPGHRLLSRHLGQRIIWRMIWGCSEVVLERGLRIGAEYWRLVSVCELRMFFDDALDCAEVKLFDRIVGETAFE